MSSESPFRRPATPTKSEGRKKAGSKRSTSDPSGDAPAKAFRSLSGEDDGEWKAVSSKTTKREHIVQRVQTLIEEFEKRDEANNRCYDDFRAKLDESFQNLLKHFDQSIYSTRDKYHQEIQRLLSSIGEDHERVAELEQNLDQVMQEISEICKQVRENRLLLFKIYFRYVIISFFAAVLFYAFLKAFNPEL